MTIPLLEYAPSSQNQRVAGFETPGDEQPRIYTTATLPSSSDWDELITAAYRQVFHEQQMLASTRQAALESQLRIGQITVRDFIQGLASSDAFRRLNYECNNNYRFVELCIQRLLGREVYHQRETLSWSMVLATKGLQGLIHDLLHSEEYVSNFGSDTVPYQRRRILPQHDRGDRPFARVARYGEDYRDQLPKSSQRLLGLGTTGLFEASERFDLQTFLQRANWSVVVVLLLSLSGVVFFLLALQTFVP